MESDPSEPKQDPTKPSFGNQKVPTQHYVAGVAIPHLILPQATGGDGALTYRLTPVPPGLSFNASVRTLSGVPANTGRHSLKWRVEDADGDAAELSFRIEADPLTTIYWAQDGAIRRSDMNGMEEESVVTHDPMVLYLAVDDHSTESALYYVVRTPDSSGPEGVIGNSIRRAAISGNDAEDVVTAASGWGIISIALDPDNGKLYWNEFQIDDDGRQIGRIRRANFDGSATEEIITTERVGVFRLALDTDSRKLCWSEINLITGADGRLRCANLDGSAPQNIVTGRPWSPWPLLTGSCTGVK